MKITWLLGMTTAILLAGVDVERGLAQVQDTSPVLTTELFESGQMRLGDAPAASLESLLQDLNRRKDYDYSQHGGQAGPDSAYLWQWVQNVTHELECRGYYFDQAGNLHQPGPIVPLR